MCACCNKHMCTFILTSYDQYTTELRSNSCTFCSLYTAQCSNLHELSDITCETSATAICDQVAPCLSWNLYCITAFDCNPGHQLCIFRHFDTPPTVDKDDEILQFIWDKVCDSLILWIMQDHFKNCCKILLVVTKDLLVHEVRERDT